jgi:putative transposase
MDSTYQSLSHSKWDCKYHVIFVFKYRRPALYGEIRRQLGPVFHELARQKECQIIEGHLMLDHAHMCIATLLKYAVASVIGFIKGKSAIAIARMQGKEMKVAAEATPLIKPPTLSVVSDLADAERPLDGYHESSRRSLSNSERLRRSEKAQWSGLRRRWKAVDTLGHLLALCVTAADEQDRAQVSELAKRVQEETGETVEIAFVDQG